MRKPKHRHALPALALRRRFAFVAAAIFASASQALATDYAWDAGSASSNNWYDPNNWNPNGFPDSTSLVTFQNIVAFVTSTNTSNDFLANSVTIDSPAVLQISSSFPTFTTLHLTSGDLTRTAASANNQAINVPALLDANGVWNINGTGQLSIAGIQENVAGLNFTKSGIGTLVISGNSSYTGTTSVNVGILRVGDNGLGPGTATVAGGATLGPTSTATVGHAVTINGTGAGGIGALNSASGSTTWSGAVTLNTNSSIGVSAGAMTISGLIDDGAFTRTLTKVGAGTLLLSNANTYGGATTVSEGILWLNNATAANNTNITVASGASLTAGSGLTFTNHAFINGTGAFDEGALHNQTGLATWDGIITLQSNSTLGASAGELLITGNINGAFNLNKVGTDGLVTLAASNTYTGTLTVSEGTVKVRNPLALSTTGTIVPAGSTLAVQETIANAAINISRPISLNGDGVAGGGALRNISSNNTWSGAVTLQSNSSVGVDADLLTITGAISGAFNLTKVGPGTLVVFSSSNSYGNTFVDDGTLSITNPNALPAAGTITVHSGGTTQISGPVTVNRNLILNGPGFNSGGALRSASGISTWNNALTLQSDSSIGVDAGELRMFGAIGGSAALTKVGAGKLTFLTANTYTGKTDVDEGVLSVEHNSGIPTSSIATVFAGAAVELRGGVAPTAELRLNGAGILNTGALRNPAATNTWAGPVTLQSTDAAVGADPNTTLTISGIIGDGSSAFPMTKVGSGTLVLSAPNTYKGGTFINGGTLSVSADNNLGPAGTPVFTNNGGKLLFSASATTGRIYALNNGSLQVAAGATLTYSNATVNGGFLRGPGTHAIGAGSAFNGVTALAGNTITQASSTTLSNFTNSGSFISNAALTWDGGYNTSAGTLTINNAFNVTALENTGTINVNSGGTLSNTVNNFVSGGSRLTVNPGGQINLNGTSLDLSGGLLVNNGTINGTVNLYFGSLAKGAGVYGPVNVLDGGRFSPGNSPGSVTTGTVSWHPGGNYTVEISDALGGAGIGWDVWNITGGLLTTASTDPAARFTVSLASLNGNSPGDAVNFDTSRDYQWRILCTSSDLEMIDTGAIALDTADFHNDVHGGSFALSSDSTGLYVNFTAIPEPTAIALAGATSLLLGRRRRQD